MIQAVKESIFYFCDNIVNGDMGASLIKISTALVASPGGEEGSVVREDFEGSPR